LPQASSEEKDCSKALVKGRNKRRRQVSLDQSSDAETKAPAGKYLYTLFHALLRGRGPGRVRARVPCRAFTLPPFSARQRT
jgi:hypothetical protein